MSNSESKKRTKVQSTTAKINLIFLQSKNINSNLEKITKKIDMLLIIELARSGLSLKETANVLQVSEDTIERMLPFKKLKPKLGKE
jgi:DNA-binding NarL/FixJ family response regulator